MMMAHLRMFLLLYASAFARQSEAMNFSMADVTDVTDDLDDSSGSVLTDDQITEILGLTNQYRCMHGGPNLSWSQPMAQSAKTWIWNKTTLLHSDSYGLKAPAGPAAENLAFHRTKIDLGQVIKAWYEECKLCSTGDCSTFTGGCTEGKDNHPVGHFTALVWKGAKEIGCSLNKVNTLLLCRYKGADKLSPSTPNIQNHFAKHVKSMVKTPEECKGVVKGSPLVEGAATIGTESGETVLSVDGEETTLKKAEAKKKAKPKTKTKAKPKTKTKAKTKAKGKGKKAKAVVTAKAEASAKTKALAKAEALAKAKTKAKAKETATATAKTKAAARAETLAKTRTWAKEQADKTEALAKIQEEALEKAESLAKATAKAETTVTAKAEAFAKKKYFAWS